MLTLTHAVRMTLLTLVAALIAWAPADAENGRRAGIVTGVHGTATVTRASLGAPRALQFRDDVMLQDRIATGDQSLARILLGGKAVITVRERSVVTITESPRVSTVDVEAGKIALAVAKERMRPGESIDLRTPNAVAGIRGTVVIAEVTGRGTDAATRFTLLTGVIEVMRLDAARRPIGAAAILNPLQTIFVDGALSPVRSITRTEGASASANFGLPVKTQPRAGAEWIASDQVTQAVAIVDPDRGRGGGGDSDRVRGSDSDSDRGRNDGDSDRGRGNDARPDPKPDKGGKADRDDKSDKVKGSPAPPPSTPIVPSSALQPSGDGKGKGRRGGRD
jgi:hypothetical protein